MLVGLPFTQGPKGWYGSSGSQGSKTLERRRNTETEEEKQRWEEMGCKAGRQTVEAFLTTSEETIRFSGKCLISKVQAAK